MVGDEADFQRAELDSFVVEVSAIFELWEAAGGFLEKEVEKLVFYSLGLQSPEIVNKN